MNPYEVEVITVNGREVGRIEKGPGYWYSAYVYNGAYVSAVIKQGGGILFASRVEAIKAIRAASNDFHKE